MTKQRKPLSRILQLAEDRHLSAAGEAGVREVQAAKEQMAQRRHYNHVCNAFDQAIEKHGGAVTVTYSNSWQPQAGTVYRNGHYYWQASRERAYHSAIIEIRTEGGEVLWLK